MRAGSKDKKQFMNAEVPIELAHKARIAAANLNISRSEFLRIATEALLDYLKDGGEMEGDSHKRLKSGKYRVHYFPRASKLPPANELAEMLMTQTVAEIAGRYNVKPSAVYARLRTAGFYARSIINEVKGDNQ